MNFGGFGLDVLLRGANPRPWHCKDGKSCEVRGTQSDLAAEHLGLLGFSLVSCELSFHECMEQ